MGCGCRPGRLRFASVLETGRDLYQDVMARAGRDTLDRNDGWYRDHMDEAHWAAQMMECLQEQGLAVLVGRLRRGR